MDHMYNSQHAREVGEVLLQRLFEESAVEVTKTETEHVFRLVAKTKHGYIRGVEWYEFEDEAQQFSNGFYATEEDAKAALRTYCKFFL